MIISGHHLVSDRRSRRRGFSLETFFSRVDPLCCVGEAVPAGGDMLDIQTYEGFRLTCSPDQILLTRPPYADHQIELPRRADELTPGSRLALANFRTAIQLDAADERFNHGWLIGHIVGNGGHNPDNSSRTYLRFWETGGDDLALIRHAAQNVQRLGTTAAFRGGSYNAQTGITTIGSQALMRLASRYIEASSKSFKPALLEAPHSFQAGFLRGFFDADGSVQGTTLKGRSVRLSQVDRIKLEWVQQMLLRLGIVSRIYFRKEAGEKLMPDGNGSLRPYRVRELWELVISKDNIERFSSMVGFYKAQKATQLADLLLSLRRKPNREMFVSTVSKITPASIGTQPVLLRSVANRSVRVEAGGFLLII